MFSKHPKSHQTFGLLLTENSSPKNFQKNAQSGHTDPRSLRGEDENLIPKEIWRLKVGRAFGPSFLPRHSKFPKIDEIFFKNSLFKGPKSSQTLVLK